MITSALLSLNCLIREAGSLLDKHFFKNYIFSCKYDVFFHFKLISSILKALKRHFQVVIVH